MCQQGQCALTNPCVSSGNIFCDDLWEGRHSVFLDCFWVNRGCVHWRIHASVLETVSVTISESAATPFSLTVSVSTGVVCNEESLRQLWKQFQWRFLRGHWLSFPWLFMSQQGQRGLTNPFVTYESTFVAYFSVGSESVFLDCLWVDRGSVGWRIHS